MWTILNQCCRRQCVLVAELGKLEWSCDDFMKIHAVSASVRFLPIGTLGAASGPGQLQTFASCHRASAFRCKLHMTSRRRHKRSSRIICSLAAMCGTRSTRVSCGQGHACLTNALISPGAAKTTDARSPCMPAPMMTGFSGSGPFWLESVLKRRLNSQTFCDLSSAVFTV